MKSGLFAAVVLGLAAASAGCGSDDAGIVDAASLSAALAGARPGDVVHVGTARIEGRFTVPAGVSLVGAGAGTVLVAPAGAAALTLAGGTPETRVSSLTIEVHGSIGVVARGGGGVALSEVTVTVAAGLGIGAEDLATLTLRNITVTGSVNAASAILLPTTPAPTDAPTYGIALVRIASAELVAVDVSGFGIAGIVATDATTVWNGGSSSGTRGTGMLVFGGTAEVTDVQLCGALAGGGLVPSYGAVFTGGADVRSQRLQVCDGVGYGILQSEARASHTDLVVRNMTEAGVWVQASDGFALSGAGSMLSGNRVAGLFAIGSSNVSVADATIAGTRNGMRIIDMAPVLVGDGVQLVDSTTDVSLSNLHLVDNDRVGLLLDVGTGSTAGVRLSAITVSGTGTALGAIAQGTTVVAGWDGPIVREGATATNDPVFTGVLEKAGAISPTDLPRAEELRAMGLAAIDGL